MRARVVEAGPRLALTRDVLTAGSGVIAAVMIYRSHPVDPEAGRSISLGYSALAALAGGLMLSLLAVGPTTVRRFRVLLGAGLVLCMVPTFVELSPRALPWQVTTPFIVLGITCVLVAVIDRVSVQQRFAWLRSVLEACALGTMLALAMWSGWVADVVSLHLANATVVMLVLQGFVYGVMILCVSRGRDVGLGVASVGAATCIAATVAREVFLWQERSVPWWPDVVFALSWPVILIGLFRATPLASTALTDGDARDERRSLISVTTIGVLSSVVAIWSVSQGRRDTATFVLAGVAALLLWARELVRARQSHALLVGLVKQSRRDPLTGLRNLRALEENLATIAQAGSAGSLTAVSVSIDRFRELIGQHGRTAGDNMLRGLADGLVLLAGDQAKVYRVEGNEFLVLGSMWWLDDAEERLGSAIDAAAASVPGAERLGLQPRAGTANLRVTRATTVDELRLLVSRSALAMHESRMQVRVFSRFEEALEVRQRRHWEIEKVMRERDAAEWLSVVYQPVFSIETGGLSSVEALSRMTYPHLGHVSPLEFVRVAENAGLIDSLGRTILQQAMTGAVRSGLIDAGKGLAVNVSVSQLRRVEFPLEVLALAEGHGIPVEQLTLEVTESVFLRADDPAVEGLSVLHTAGVRIVLDDFGTGYSALSYLTRLPVHGLKIDRAITSNLDDGRTRAIARSILTMADDLGFGVVVEGVETAQQEELVRELGTCHVQGWLYAKAMGVDALAELVARSVANSQLMTAEQEHSVIRLPQRRAEPDREVRLPKHRADGAP